MMLAQTPEKENTQAEQQTQGMLEVTGTLSPEHQAIFPVEAQTFLSQLCERFSLRVDQLLTAREERQNKIDQGELPDFLTETQDIREGSWKILGIPTICKIVESKLPGQPIVKW